MGWTRIYGRLQVLVIGDRQSSYKNLTIPSGLSFAWEQDIIDTDGLLKIIDGLDIEKLERVAQIVSREVKVVRPSDPAPAQPSPRTTLAFDGFQTRVVQLRHPLQDAIPGWRGPTLASAGARSLQGGHTTNAKWDDRPNPLRNDDLSQFAPEMVRRTTNQNLYVDTPYAVPILIFLPRSRHRVRWLVVRSRSLWQSSSACPRRTSLRSRSAAAG